MICAQVYASTIGTDYSHITMRLVFLCVTTDSSVYVCLPYFPVTTVVKCNLSIIALIQILSYFAEDLLAAEHMMDNNTRFSRD